MTHYILNSGETVRVLEIQNLPGPPVKVLYTLQITNGRNKGSELRLTDREMVLNGAKKLLCTVEGGTSRRSYELNQRARMK